jgi:hypothetical protein
MMRRMARRGTLFAAVTFVVLGAGAAAPARAASLSIDVDDEQTVTITGSSESLRATITELCRRANVELVAYEAPDRPIAAAYQRIPLSEALGRLLRSEIFLVGIRPGERPTSQVVTWLRVSGSTGGVASAPASDGAAAAAPAASGPALDLGVAQNLIDTALTSQDTFSRNNARRTILEALRGDPAPLQRFLDNDVSAVVEQIAAYPHAAELLNSLQSVTTSVEQRTKIQTLLRSLRMRQDSDRRKTASGNDAG